MKKKPTRAYVSWKDKIIEPKKIKQDGKGFVLVSRNRMKLIKEDE